MTAAFSIRPTGDANVYDVMEHHIDCDPTWFCVIRFNGELLPATQELYLRKMLKNLKDSA